MAHTVQQRVGVKLESGVGNAGDTYERHANAVADRVVAGRSAEGMLERFAGARGKDASGGMAGGGKRPPALQMTRATDAVAKQAESLKGALTWRQAGLKKRGKKKGDRMMGATSKNPFSRKVNYFARWIKGERVSPAKLRQGMNCWEAILFAAMESSIVTDDEV